MADPGDGTPTWRQRRLGMELRRLREERNLGPHTAASLLGRTESSLSKLENAQRGIRKPALEQILDKYQVTDEPYRDALFTLARDAKKQGWWQRYEGTHLASLLDYLSIEAGASRIHSCELHLVPGLLQTEAYARAVVSAGLALGDSPDVNGLASIRMQRQQILSSARIPSGCGRSLVRMPSGRRSAVEAS